MWSKGWLPRLHEVAAWEGPLRDPGILLPREHSTVGLAGTAPVDSICCISADGECTTPAARALPSCTTPTHPCQLATLWHCWGVTCALPSHLLCSHLPLQAPDAPLGPLHLPRSRQACGLQLRKLLLQAECPLSRSVQLMPQVPHLQAQMKCCGRQVHVLLLRSRWPAHGVPLVSSEGAWAQHDGNWQPALKSARLSGCGHQANGSSATTTAAGKCRAA